VEGARRAPVWPCHLRAWAPAGQARGAGWYWGCSVGSTQRGLLTGASASGYAQIDITATETAHRVGARHAQTREERLSELEQRRKGAPQ
jgi:hypothetical protein